MVGLNDAGCSRLDPIIMRAFSHTIVGVDTAIKALEFQKSSFLGPKMSKICTIMSNDNFLLILRAIQTSCIMYNMI